MGTNTRSVPVGAGAGGVRRSPPAEAGEKDVPKTMTYCIGPGPKFSIETMEKQIENLSENNRHYAQAVLSCWRAQEKKLSTYKNV